MKKIIVTGGAGFIGSNLVRYLIENTNYEVFNVDKLTYAGNLLSLKDIENNERYSFKQLDICNFQNVTQVINDFQPDSIMHLAAESHVDRSIDNPSDFINTNILGTYNLLQNTYLYYKNLSEEKKNEFRFLHISTDEVFGSLDNKGFFTEKTPYDPRSPYSASKAASDHLVRAWFHTFGLPILITNCSNNYGPYQFPEKLIPVVILNAIYQKPIPVYGNGENIRDWLFVEDHVAALMKVLENGRAGETYNIGGKNEKKNLELVNTICEILDALKPFETSYKNLIEFVKDRPGHDLRYAIDPDKIKNELNFEPEFTFETGIRKTVQWYLDNLSWCEKVLENKYELQRLGQIE